MRGIRVFDGLTNGFDAKSPVITIGTFDGVHIGHQKIIQRLNVEAELIGGTSTLFTFHPHPRLVLNPTDSDLKLLQTREEKIAKLERMGLQNIIMYPFTKEFSQLSANEFVRDILVDQIGAQKVIIGYDHQFGKNREGGLDFLREMSKTYGFEVIEIPAQEIDDVNVSSSKIRRALQNGDVEMANNYLTEPYELTGVVIKGKALGRTIQFPTANLDVQTGLKLIPKNGVYAVRAILPSGLAQFAMMNIGNKPTVQESNNISLEVHLLDWTGDLYGQKIRVQFLRYLRDEQKFENTQELQHQLKQDAEQTRQFFAALV